MVGMRDKTKHLLRFTVEIINNMNGILWVFYGIICSVFFYISKTCLMDDGAEIEWNMLDGTCIFV